MAGGNLFGRVFTYLFNEAIVEGLANNRAFQRFAVRTSKAIEEISSKAAEARENLTKQVKEASKNDDFFNKR